MGAVDQSSREDNETINSNRKVADVLTAVVLDKIGAPGREVLSIEDDLWPEARVTTRRTTADALDGASWPARALASSDMKYETSLSIAAGEQRLSSNPLSNAFVDSHLQQKIGSRNVAEAASTARGGFVIDRHALVRTDVRSSVLATGDDSFPGKTTGVRVSLKPTSTGGTDVALPPSQSTSEDDQLNSGGGLDERRQKRMLSNRESARRSRLRKQQHLDELRAEVDKLQAEKSSMVANYNAAAEQFSQLTRENNALRKHAEDLYQKILKLRQKNDGVAPDWWRALDIEHGDQNVFAPDHLSVYLQPSLPGILP